MILMRRMTVGNAADHVFSIVQGLGMLSVEPSDEQKQHFMDYKSHLLNEVIGILAVLIVIMNVIISAMAASTK
jgi:hypothetical protein